MENKKSSSDKLIQLHQEVDTQGFINLEDASNRLNGNLKVYKTILSSFLKNSGFAELVNSVEKSDMNAAKQAAHAIKGVCGNLSLTALYKSIAELDDKLKNGTLDQNAYQTCLDSFEKTKPVISALLEKM